VVIHADEPFVKKTPLYAPAKEGDARTAETLVLEASTLDALDRISAVVGDSKPELLAVHALETKGVNSIPRVFARIIAKMLDLPVASGIIQINRVAPLAQIIWRSRSACSNLVPTKAACVKFAFAHLARLRFASKIAKSRYKALSSGRKSNSFAVARNHRLALWPRQQLLPVVAKASEPAVYAWATLCISSCCCGDPPGCGLYYRYAQTRREETRCRL
jgi:hypothetical protein